MRYYRITFSKVINPSDTHWNWQYEWYELICTANNADEARDHGKKVAEDNGLRYACTYNLTPKYGKNAINRTPAIQRIER